MDGEIHVPEGAFLGGGLEHSGEGDFGASVMLDS